MQRHNQDYLKTPRALPGQRIGLFGGSFNPPHKGHLLLAQTCLKRLKLDQVWWMVTPGNPLKDHSRLAPLAERIAASRTLCHDRRIKITGFEAAHDLHASIDTITHLQARNQGVKFVWLVGADSLVSFHRWKEWKKIANALPLAVYNRPGTSLAPASSRFAKTFSSARLGSRHAPVLAHSRPPAWIFLQGPMSPLSSTQIRQQQSR